MEEDLYSFAERLGRNMSRVVDASAGVCPLGPSKKVKAAVRKAVKDIDLYPDPKNRRLRKFFLSKFGISGNCIFFSNSKERCIRMISSVFSPQRVGIVSNPDLITGTLSDRVELLRKLSETADRGSLVILDESLIEFTGDDVYYDGLCKNDNIVVVRTTANFHGLAGLELAWAVSSPATIERLEAASITGINVLASAAAITALKDKTYRKSAIKLIRDERITIFNALKKIEGIKVMQSDSNVFVIKALTDPSRLLNKFTREGFLTRDCRGLEGLGEKFLRLSVMSHDLNKKLIRIFKETFSKDNKDKHSGI